MEKIDNLDKKILSILSQNARIPFKDVAADCGVPFTNYGTALAYMQGILKRTLGVFPDLQKMV